MALSFSHTLHARAERHYTLLLAFVLGLAALLRFWQLSAVPHPYFDEINIPHFGFALLQDLRQTPFMTAHPPLPHYLFAGAISLYYHLPWVEGGLPDSWRAVDPLSYRWLTACMGVLCCALAAGIVRRLGGQATIALLAALFLALDGALIVDSRAGLNNIVMLVFGMTAVWLFTVALADQLRWRYFLLSGAFLGATVSVKWNGLGFWLVPTGFLAWLFMLTAAAGKQFTASAPLNISTDLLIRTIIALLVLPAAIYSLLWLPYLLHEQRWGFWEIHQLIQAFHTEQVGANDHPYCSAWYQWPYQGRPMSYFFEKMAGEGGTIFKAIHLLGNPLLYPLSFIAVLFTSVRWGWQCVEVVQGKLHAWSMYLAATTVVLLGFWGNFLPWALVDRCLFSYHYEPASAFAFIALAASLVWLWQVSTGLWTWPGRLLVLIFVLLILCASFFWLPLALGLPLSSEAFYERMWFSAWI